MTARLSEHGNEAASDRSSVAIEHESPDSRSVAHSRVVSVSARESDQTCSRQNAQGEDGKMSNGSAGAAKTVFLTPRVIDQDAFDELSHLLCDLIERASVQGANLGDAVVEAGRIEHQLVQSNSNLQERLRLSARMLKAFQSQIVRIESGIADVEEQRKGWENAQAEIDAAREQLRETRDAALSATEEELRRATSEAIAKFDHAVAERVQRIEELNARIEAFEQRAASLEKAIETAERNADAVVQCAETASKRLESQTQEAGGTIEQCEQARRILGEHLLEATDAVDRFEQRCGEVSSSVQAQDERITAMLPRVEQISEQLKGLTNDLNESERLRSELAALLSHLRDWEPLLRWSDAKETGNGELPEPLVQVVEAVKSRVEANLNTFSSALRHIADGFEQCADEASPSSGKASRRRMQSTKR